MTRQQELIEDRLFAAYQAAASAYRAISHNLHANASVVAAFDKARSDYTAFLDSL